MAKSYVVRPGLFSPFATGNTNACSYVINKTPMVVKFSAWVKLNRTRYVHVSVRCTERHRDWLVIIIKWYLVAYHLVY